MPLSLQTIEPVAPFEHRVIGVSTLIRLAFSNAELMPLWTTLMKRVAIDPGDAGALFDMSVILQASGQMETGLALQQGALAVSRHFCRSFGNGTGPRLLVLMTAGNFMANTPIEFLLEGSDIHLTMLFVDAELRDLGDISSYDLLFMAVGESESNGPVLANIAHLLEGVDFTVVNGNPAAVAALSRDGVARCLAGEPSLLAPMVRRQTRDEIQETYPLVIRPVGSHAGQGLEKIVNETQLARYLEATDSTEFYVSPFIDYRSADGLYRKQRVVVIDGEAFPSHMAISQHWMVHYLNAQMTEMADRRAEECRWMTEFEVEFAQRHAPAFRALHRQFGLDYFTIDCAELPDGRLLLFEADVAMIVHDMDPVDIFPYKKPAMQKLFKAFQQALCRRMRAKHHNRQ